jgi:hypothetical protein
VAKNDNIMNTDKNNNKTKTTTMTKLTQIQIDQNIRCDLRVKYKGIIDIADFVGQCDGYRSHKTAEVLAHTAALDAAIKVLTEKSNDNPLSIGYESYILLQMLKEHREIGQKMGRDCANRSD